MKFYNIYFFDFFFKLFYCLISFICLFIICFNNINNFFLFEIFPFLKIFYYKRFITTQVTHLFNIVWTLSFFYSLTLVFPLLAFKCLVFFRSGWFVHQVILYKWIIIIVFLSYLNLWFFSHLNVIPFILNFFLSWELSDNSYLLRIETEISFYHYLLWLILFKNNLSFMIMCVCNLFMMFFVLKKILFLYYFFKRYKNLLGFALIVFIYLLIPPDLIIQFLLILVIYFMIELFFYFFCILFYKYLKMIRCLQ